MILAASYVWYVERAGGIVAYALLSGSVILGLVLSGRAKLSGWPRFAVVAGLTASRFAGPAPPSELTGRHVPDGSRERS